MISSRFPRKERRSVLLGLRPTQVALLMMATVGVVAGVAVQTAGWVRISIGSFALLAAVIALTRIESVPTYRWGTLRFSHMLRSASNTNSYRQRLLSPERVAVLRLPGRSGLVQLLEDQGRIGMVYEARARRLTAVARVLGPAHLLQDRSEQDRRVIEYGRLIAGLCREGRLAGVQIVERTLPDSADGLATWATDRGLDDETAAGRIYRDLLNHAAPAAARHETLVGISLDLAATARESRRYGRGIAGAARVLASEARAFQAALVTAGVNGRWLAAGEIAVVIRTAFDPSAAKALESRTTGLPAEAASPIAIDVEWDHIRTDSTFQRVYQVDEWPRIVVTSGFLSPLLLKPSIRRTFSLVMRPIPAAQALRDARRDRVERVTDRSTRSRIGQLESAQDRQVDADVIQREVDLAEGHADVRWVGLLAVAADTLDELEDACAQLELAASQSMLDLRRVVGQQAEALVAAAVPLCTGLD